MGETLSKAVSLAGEFVGLAIFPYLLGALFAVSGRVFYEAATATGSSRFRQYAHFWVAGMIVWGIASGKFAGAAIDYGW